MRLVERLSTVQSF